jgi:hypothetical protein
VPTLAKRALGAVLALVGLGVCVVGVWFTVHMGTSGTAAFTLRPTDDGPVVIGPDVVNRVDLRVTIRARAVDGGGVWIGVAAPTDARSAVDEGALTVVNGVSVRDWTLLSHPVGSGEAPELVHADLWRQQATGKGDTAVTVLQASAPETVVITADGGKVDSVTLSVQKKTWFVQALLAALSGLLLAVAGLTIALTAGRPPASWESLAPGTEPRRSRRHSRSMGRTGRNARESGSATPEPRSASGTTDPASGTTDPASSTTNPASSTTNPASDRPTTDAGGAGADAGRSSRSNKGSGRGYQPRRAAAKGEGTSR